MEHVTVQGHRVPALGMGTWRLEGETCRKLVEQALDLGYRHIDSAQIYGNEASIGQALKASSTDRADMFITTKIWNEHHAPDDVRSSTEESLRRLGTSHVDLLLLHWPGDLGMLPWTLEAMLLLREQEKVRLIGVSNFTPTQLELALKHAPISCNQVEYHPYLAQPRMCRLAQEHGFLLTAFAPLARGMILDDPTLTSIGLRHGKTPVQVVLRWLLGQEQVAAVPKPDNYHQLMSNLDIFDFQLTQDETRQIHDLDRHERIVDPPWGQRDWES